MENQFIGLFLVLVVIGFLSERFMVYMKKIDWEWNNILRLFASILVAIISVLLFFLIKNILGEAI